MSTRNFKQLLAIAFVLLLNTLVQAQVDPAIVWQTNLGGSTIDRVLEESDMKCQTADGGFIIPISSNSTISGNKTENNIGALDCWIVKLDATGAIQWQNNIGGNSYDQIYSIEQTSDGGYILGCISESNISGDKTENSKGQSDYWIVKLDASGTISWQKTYGGVNQEFLTSIHQTSDGGYIAGGITESPLSGDITEGQLAPLDYDFWILKLDNLGNIQWQNRINTIGHESNTEIKQTIDGGYILGGTSLAGISGDKTENSNGADDYWVLKLDNLGNIQWQNTIGGSSIEYLYSLIQTNDGGYMLGGFSQSPISGDKTENIIGGVDYWIVKLDNLGNLTWDKTYGADGQSWLLKVQQQSDGGYLLGGFSNANNGIGNKNENSKGVHDYWLVKTDALGNLLWENTLGANIEDFLIHVEVSTDGNIFAVGSSSSNISSDKSSNGFGDYDVWAMKLKMPKHVIHGTVFLDTISNCNLDSLGEPAIVNKIIKDYITGNTTINNLDGAYSLPIYSDNALLEITNLLAFENTSCVDSIYINFDTTSSYDTFNVDYPITGPDCQYLIVNINSSQLAPCRYATYVLPYSNVGFDTAFGAVIYVIVDTTVLDSFSSLSPFTQMGDTLIFPIGDVMPFQNGAIYFTAFVDCDAIIGTSACVGAYIYPLTDCPPPIVGYDSSDIELETSCDDDTVLFIAKNRIGAHGMTSPGIIQVIEDDIVLIAYPIVLDSAQDTTIRFRPLSDKTATIKFYQNPNHPTRPILIKHNEFCSLTAPIKINSVIGHFPRYDDVSTYEEVCTQIRASYDPNIKSVVPQGYTTQHYTDSNQVLEYRIDFQNTGLDTARKVVIVDTLSTWFKRQYICSISFFT